MPRATPFGSGVPHAAFSAASCKTFLRRAVSRGLPSLGLVKSGIFRAAPIKRKRNAKGSAPAAAASSSTKVSTTKPLLECSTERHHARGTPDLANAYSTRKLGVTYGINAAVANSLASGFSWPFLSQTAAMEVEL